MEGGQKYNSEHLSFVGEVQPEVCLVGVREDVQLTLTEDIGVSWVGEGGSLLFDMGGGERVGRAGVSVIYLDERCEEFFFFSFNEKPSSICAQPTSQMILPEHKNVCQRVCHTEAHIPCSAL